MRRFGIDQSKSIRRLAFAAILLSTGSPAFAQGDADGLSARIRKATARVEAAVVSIRPLGVVPQVSVVPPVVVAPFVRIGGGPVPTGRVERMTSGSGVILDARRGLVATTGQVLRGTRQAEVMLPDGSIRPALRINPVDPNTDLVLIEFDPKGLELAQAEWADSRSLQLGDRVLAVGRSALGKTLASAGIVSASVDPSEAGSELEPIQTDALITAETAGGALVNLEGQVVGISQARGDLVGGGDTREGFRLAIPEALVRRLTGGFLGDGRARHGYLGVTLEPGRRLKGVVVAGVTAGSPAEDAGLMTGDRIISIDGRVVRDAQSLSRAVEMAAIGQEMKLVVERDGKKFEAKFLTRARPDVFAPSPPDPLEETTPDGTLPALPAPDERKTKLPPALPEGPFTEPKDEPKDL